MAGHYHTKKREYLPSIQKWIDRATENNLRDEYQDIHLDEISNDFESKDSWIGGGLFLFGCILELIDKSKFDVMLVFTLITTDKPTPVKINSIIDIYDELDITPPSFYLFVKGNKNYEDTIKASEYLEEVSRGQNFNAYFREEKEQNEYNRMLYIKSKLYFSDNFRTFTNRN